MESNGIWAIVNTDMVCIDIYNGNIFNLDVSAYENYGGEVGIGGEWAYREGAIGKTYNHDTDKFE